MHSWKPSTCIPLSVRNLSIQASRNRYRQTGQIDKTRYNIIQHEHIVLVHTEPVSSNHVSHDMISMHIRHHDSPHPSICRAQDPKAGQGSIVNQPRSFWRQARGARRSTHGLVRLPVFLYCINKVLGDTEYGIQGTGTGSR